MSADTQLKQPIEHMRVASRDSSRPVVRQGAPRSSIGFTSVTRNDAGRKNSPNRHVLVTRACDFAKRRAKITNGAQPCWLVRDVGHLDTIARTLSPVVIELPKSLAFMQDQIA